MYQFDTAMNPAALARTAPSVTVQNEDDLAAVVLYAWIDPAGIGTHAIDVYSIFPNDLVMWTESTKGSRLHRGEISNGQVTANTKLATLTSGTDNNVFTRTVYMEANAEVVGNVELHAKFTDNHGHPNGYDSAKMTSVDVDLDIDSDNTSTFAPPSRSLYEDSIEDLFSHYGKLITPNHADTDNDGTLDCWDGYSTTGYYSHANPNSSRQFIPIVVQITTSTMIDYANTTVSFDYKMFSITPPQDTSQPSTQANRKQGRERSRPD